MPDPATSVPFVTVLVMAGSGARLGHDLPKALVPFAGRPLWTHSAVTLSGVPGCLGLVLVVPADRIEEVAEAAEQALPVAFAVVAGGERRQDSVRLGLAAVEDVLEGGDERPQVIAIHDAARPLLTASTAAAVIAAAADCGAALAAVPARDTIKRVDEDGFVLDTPDRTGLWQAQTPQCFRLDLVRRAHEVALGRGVTATDDAALVEGLGMPVRAVRSDDWNFKITTPADLALGEALLAGRGEPSA